MPLTLDEAATEFGDDVSTFLACMETDAEKAQAVMMKYARLLMIRETLPTALLALQFHVKEPKAKEGIAAALRILALTRGVVLPKPVVVERYGATTKKIRIDVEDGYEEEEVVTPGQIKREENHCSVCVASTKTQE